MKKTFNTLAFSLFSIFYALSPSFSLAQTTFESNPVASSFSNPAGLFAGDLDQDGDIDLLAASGTHGVFLLRNEGGDPIQWVSIVIDANLGASLTVWMDDIDSDGFMDIVSGGWNNGQVIWYRNAGDHQTFQKKLIASGFESPHEVRTADLDRDGDPDVFAAAAGSNQIAWWKNEDGLGNTWTKQVIKDQFRGARSLDLGDLDQDGDLDVAGASLDGDEVSIWRNDGGNPIVWTEINLTNSFNGSHRVQLVDMDADGDIDILGTAYGAATIAWWENPGLITGNWEKRVVDTGLPSAVIGTAVDLDEDGDMDVIGTGQDANMLVWYEQTGLPSNPWKKTVLSSDFGGAWPVCVGDFDQDGSIDFAVGGASANKIEWFKSSQAGRFTRLIDWDLGTFHAGFFIPEEQMEELPLFLVLPNCDDPLAYSRLRDILIPLALETNAILMVPEVFTTGSPNYVLEEPGIIERALQYASARFSVDADSVYLIGMDCTGKAILDYGQNYPEQLRGVIPFNPGLSSLDANAYLQYPNLPVCLCSGSEHPDRSNHFLAVEQANQSYGKAFLRTLEGVSTEVLVDDLIEQLLWCKNYIDTVQGGTLGMPEFPDQATFSIYPNPATEGFTLEQIGNSPLRSIELVDVMGREVVRILVPENQEKSYFSFQELGLSSGIYLASVRLENKVISKRLVVNR